MKRIRLFEERDCFCKIFHFTKNSDRKLRWRFDKKPDYLILLCQVWRTRLVNTFEDNLKSEHDSVLKIVSLLSALPHKILKHTVTQLTVRSYKSCMTLL